MSADIKPVAWRDPACRRHVIADADRHDFLTANGSVGIMRAERYTEPLYTADQLQAAVLAERERCAKICEGEKLLDNTATAGDIAYDLAIEHCSAAIRKG